MFRMNGMPRAQGCAGAASVVLVQCLWMNGMPRAQGCAGAASFKLAQCHGCAARFVSFAQNLATCLGAKAMWSPVS